MPYKNKEQAAAYLKEYNAARSEPRRTTRGGGKGPSSESIFRLGRFCLHDGEGATIDGVHTYIMLLSSEGDRLINPAGLSTQVIFEYFMDLADKQPKKTINAGFATGYDVNMILHSLSPKHVTAIYKSLNDQRGVDVRLGGRLYNVYWQRTKHLTIREFDPVRHKQRVRNRKTGKLGPRKPLRRFCLWDTWQFFQTSFVKTIEDWLVLTEEEKAEVAVITKHKGERSTFRPEDIDDIAAYCTLELKYLKRIAQQLHADLVEAGLPIRRWDGTGAIASTMLGQHEVKKFKAPRPPRPDTPTPDSMRAGHLEYSGRMAYAGGCIWQGYLGHTDQTCFHYDKISAYPSQMPDMPCLACGRWEWVTRYEPGSYGIWDVRWDYRATYTQSPWRPMPFFHRCKDGTLFYPPAGTGRYWTPQVDAALDHLAPGDRLDITGGWVYRPGCADRPFAFVREVFARRQLWKATCYRCGHPLLENGWCLTCGRQSHGKGGQRVLKGGLNGMTGKMAQQLGARPPNPKKGETEWKIPATFELLWAGYVTAATRADLYRVAMIAPDDCLLIQTDGITMRHDISERLDVGPGLGQWEIKKPWLETLTIQPGVYMARTGPDRANPAHWTIHYRGFDKRQPTDDNPWPYQLWPDLVLDAWERQLMTLTLQSTRFIGAGSCVALQDTNPAIWKLWCQWVSKDKDLLLFPSKYVQGQRRPLPRATSRYVHGSGVGYATVYGYPNPAHGLLPLEPPEVSTDARSAPYDLLWLHGVEDPTDYSLRLEDGVPHWLWLEEFEEGHE